MTIRTRNLPYRHDGTALEAFVAWDDAAGDAPRPGVLVAHTWRGRGDFENDKALLLAELGYVGFALDVYGAGEFGRTPEECERLSRPYFDDRRLLAGRLQAALDAMRALDVVDAGRLAAIGFCFGGMCVLDLARGGAGLAGVVSFHGLLHAPPTVSEAPIATRILVLHGWDDPMAPPAAVLALADELGARRADWQLHAYGGVVHAFTNPAAADRAAGLAYDARTEQRALRSMRDFLGDLFIDNNK